MAKLNWLRWVPGRLNNGYRKLCIISSRYLKFDMYLLHFPEGASAPHHRDPASRGYEHHRIDIILKDSDVGGRFYIGKSAVRGRFCYFRPDHQSHSITPVLAGSLWMLSIGWLRKEKNGGDFYVC